MWQLILSSVLSFVFGSGLVAFLRYRQDAKKANLTFFEEELARYKAAYETLKEEVDKLKLSLIPTVVPEWRKDVYGKYVYVSPAYEIFILLPLNLTTEDIIGKTDEEIFSPYPDFIKVLKELDKEARISLRRFAIRRGVQFPGHPETLMVIKEISQTIDGVTYFIGRCYSEY